MWSRPGTTCSSLVRRLVAGLFLGVGFRCEVLVYVGHLPQPAGGKPLITGKVGKDLTTQQGQDAAKIVALNILSSLKDYLGDLDRVKKIVKLVGFVNCVDGFTEQPMVINGCSNLLGEVFGEKGTHARSAVGTNALPLGVSVEIEAIVEIEEKK
jgi:enamine deaminase RidA (YjgF/YER057c/UK114 family)